MNDRVQSELARLRALRWTGPDRNERVEHFLRERSHMETRRNRSRVTAGVVLATVFGGGALAGAMTHHLMTRSVVLKVSDTEAWQVPDVPAGAQFIPPNIYIDENEE